MILFVGNRNTNLEIFRSQRDLTNGSRIHVGKNVGSEDTPKIADTTRNSALYARTRKTGYCILTQPTSTSSVDIGGYMAIPNIQGQSP